MKPTSLHPDYSVKAICPDCGAVSVFDHKEPGREFGFVTIKVAHTFQKGSYSRILYRLLRCSGCGRGALAKFHDTGNPPGVLESFLPRATSQTPLPPGVPEGILREYREAELCASVEAWRGASALLRSTLEKALKANGYVTGSLQTKIDEAAKDGVITAARSQKAHEDIRVLGNEVVHDDWRQVDETEVELALHYAQRVLEDLYDDRDTVEKILTGKGRIQAG